MKRDKKVAKEAVEVTHEALELTRDAILGFGEIGDRQNDVIREALAIARGAVAVAGTLSDKLYAVPHGEVLSTDELHSFAEAAPQWSVTAGISDGKAIKSYQRTICADELVPERRPGGELERETYLSLADIEHSDFGLASIFGTYSFSGDYMDGKYYIIRVYAEDAGPVTYDDFAKVLDAEEYLIAEGYILPPVEQPVKV